MKYGEVIPKEFVLPSSLFCLKKDLETNPFKDVIVKDGDRVMDCGSAVGTFAVAALENGAASVRCYEPFPKNEEVLRGNVAKYGDRVIVLKSAVVASQEPSVTFFLSGFNGSHSIVKPRSDAKRPKPVKVEALNFRSELAAFRPQVVKLDVEGAEYDLLASLRPGDLADVRSLFIEFHPNEARQQLVDEVSRFLSSEGFTVVNKRLRAFTVVRESHGGEVPSIKGSGGKRTRAAPAKLAAPPKRWPADDVRRFKLDDLLPYARNPRLHSDEQVDRLAKAIERWGFTVPVAVDRSGEIIAGHGRLLAAKKLRLKEVPGFFRPDDWTDDDVKAYRIWDNQSALLSEWSPEMLRLEMTELKLESYDLSLLGFEQHTLDWYTGDGLMVGPDGQWTGMPGFTQEDKTAFRTVKIHFTCQEDVEAFARLLGQKITENTKFLWFPPIEAESRMTTTYVQQAAE